MHHSMRISSTIVAIFITISAAAQKPTRQPDSLIHPFTSAEDVEVFLNESKIIKQKGTPVGVTNPWRLTLDDGRVQHDALFKYIDVRKLGIQRFEDGTPEYDFKDSWKFEVAAYEIDKLLSLGMVAPTVERTYRGRKGSLQYWVEGKSALECEKEGLKPPDSVGWRWQLWKKDIFDKLVYNIDRNLGNIKVTPEWKLVMIDHSRCFKSLAAVKDINELEFFSRSLMEALENLDEGTVKRECGSWLTDPEIGTMMKRRDLIVAHYRKLVEEKGLGITYH